MAYLVLARKWRPSVFDDVVGQHHITQTLRNAVEQDRVPHALLFSGSRGIGKTSCARILAKALNCESGPTPTPCGKCSACVDIASGRSIDVFEIDGASNNSVEQIREIRESVKFVPTAGRRKVYIIDEVHMLSVSAFNALLKTLEEPPEHVLFIFATTEPHKIPDTILSRCQRFDFRRISESQLVSALQYIATQERIEVDESVLVDIAREARGGMRDSLSLLDQVISFCGESVDADQARQVLGIAGRAQLTDMFIALKARQGQRVLELLEAQHQRGADLEKYAHRFVDFLRDLLVLRICPQPERLLDQEGEELTRMSTLVRDLEPADLHRMLGSVLRHVDEMTRSAFPKLRLEMALLEICEQGATLPISDLIDAIEHLREGAPQVSKKKTIADQQPVDDSVAVPMESNRSQAGVSESEGPTASVPQDSPAPSPTLSSAQDSMSPFRSDNSLPEAQSPQVSVPLKLEQRPTLETDSEPVKAQSSTDVKARSVGASGSSSEVSAPQGTQTVSVSKSNSQSAYKKRPSKRSGGYDDFSATPPMPWAPEECSDLEVKSRRKGSPSNEELDLLKDSQSQTPIQAPSTSLDLNTFCRPEASDLDRYGALLTRLRQVDTFLTSDLEQNSHVITFTAKHVDIAFETTEHALVERAKTAFEQLFGSTDAVNDALSWHSCEASDARLAGESLYQRRQRRAAAILKQRKVDAEDHESVRLAKEALGGQVLDILPR
jgi:DNA polymerase-3 subunit gamma/tau